MSQANNKIYVQPEQSYEETDFFATIRDGIEKEKEAKRDEVREYVQYNTLEQAISLLGGTKNAKPFKKNAGGRSTTYSFTLNSSNIINNYRIYPDNEVLISVDDFGLVRDPPDLKNAPPIEAEVINISDNRLTVTLFVNRADKQKSLEAFKQAFRTKNSSYGIIPLLNPVPFERVSRSVNEIQNIREKKEIILGQKNISFDKDEVSEVPDELNESQKRAFIKCQQANHVALIHGPPGTGKSRTLSELIRSFVNQGKKVLLTAHSNQAVDNLIMGSSQYYDTDENAIHYDALHDKLTISRVGSGSRNEIIQANYTSIPSATADVVAGTMNSIEKFDENEFDVAVVDESSQSPLHSTLIPIVKSKKIILAGDHKQLPPYSSTENEQKDIGISLFEHLIEAFGSEIKSFLRTQYRMNKKIADFPNQEFYEGQLETAEQNHDWTVFNLDPVKAFHVDGVEQQTENKSYKNTSEVAVICDKIEALDQLNVSLDCVGIIAAYRGQVTAIKNALSDMDMNTDKIKVDTIDSFQGSEKDIIFVSFVRSNNNGNTGFLTFPNEGGRRLNVAMTRAKKRLVLVGNWETLRTQSENEDCSDIYDRLYEHLKSEELIIE